MKEFTYKWNLSDLGSVEKNNLKVFSCFSCAGGSTMGYKMSGFDVIGCNEIDPKMMDTYKKNHNPRYSYLESIETFHKRRDLPKELYGLDILDGSPPCSSFSTSGNREKNWGDKKKFREGQESQVLDDLFFHFIELAKNLQPKVIVAENVKGLIIGNAKGYVKKINELLNQIGYNVQLFLLDASLMGLPQKRERVFFVCSRKDLKFSKIKLSFNERKISVKEAFESIKDINYKGPDRSKSKNFKYWQMCKPGETFSKYHPKMSLFNWMKIPINNPSCTLTAQQSILFHYESMRNLSTPELQALSSFPLDFNFENDRLAGYQMGMSVPPMMMHKISREIYKQWFQ